MKKILSLLVCLTMIFMVASCGGGEEKPSTSSKNSSTESANQSENEDSSGESEQAPKWENGAVTYKAKDIPALFASTPSGYAVYDEASDTATIKSLSPELDNYGGIQTDILPIDFNYPVIFSIDIVECYIQYIVKMYVAGESASYYVLSDEGESGRITVDVQDAMLCEKYRERNTQPDPGYENGFKFQDKQGYSGAKQRCSFYIMAKGPYDEMQSASMKIKEISITNINQPRIENIEIKGDGVVNNKLEVMKGSNAVQLTGHFNPSTISNKNVAWECEDNEVASVSESGLLTFNGVGKTKIRAISKADMSKSGFIELTVKSGYENDRDKMISALNSIENGKESQVFNDIYRSYWENMLETPQAESNDTLVAKVEKGSVRIENYYKNGSSPFDYNITFENADKVICCDNGMVEVTSSSGKVKVNYQENSLKTPSHNMKVLLIRGNNVTKFDVKVKAVTLIKDYSAKDIVNLWEDGDKHVLASGKAEMDGECAKITENNIVESYGGVTTKLFKNIDTTKQIEIILDVDSTSHNNKVKWDMRIVYFENGYKMGNPRSLEASTKQGEITIYFAPKYSEVMFYLVANGNDVSGGALEGASIKIRSVKLQYLDD